MVMEMTRTTDFETQTNDHSQVKERKKTNEELFSERTGIQKAIIETLVKIAKENKGDAKFDVARDVLDSGLANIIALEEQIEAKTLLGSNYDAEKDKRKVGILAEVCTILTLEKLGFNVVNSTISEDLDHGLDLYAIAPAKYGEGQMWAIQIKSTVVSESVEFIDLKNAKTELAVYQPEKSEKSFKQLLNYVSDKNYNPFTTHPEFVDEFWIRPVAIVLPSGRNNGVFKRNGEPIENFPQQLEKVINNVFPPKPVKKDLETSVRG